jgi:hypothetical protein
MTSAPVPTTPVAAPERWLEPTSLLPLRWGRYRPRYLAAVVLVLAGALVMQAGSAYADYLILIGMVAHVAGWLILPARGARRAAVAIPSVLLVGSLLFGSIAAVLLVGPFAFWLSLRQRPAASYLAALLPLVSGLILAQLYPQYGDGAIVVFVSLIVVAASAWIARSIARSRVLTGRNRLR